MVAWCKSGTRTSGAGTLGLWDPGPPSKFKSESSGLLSKFKKEIHLMVFLHYFTYYTLYEKLRNFFTEIIFHEFPLCPYCPLNKVMCFKLISPGFFRKDFIIEDLLDIHEKILWKVQAKAEKAVFVLLEFVNEQWYSNWKYTTCKCLVDLQI